MRNSIGRLLAGLLLVGAFTALNPASAKTLKVGGTGAMTETLRQIAPHFRAQTGIVLEVISSLGTSGGYAATADGVLGFSFGGRDLRPKETARGLTVAKTFLTPFGLATSRSGPDGFRRDEITKTFQSDHPVWPDRTEIMIVLRPVDESDNILLGELFPGMSEAIRHLQTRPDLSIASTDQDNAEMAEKTEGSLVGITMAQMTSEKRNLRFVNIDNVPPSLDNYENGSYPYAKILYLVVPAEVSPDAAAFLTFITTPAGLALLRKTAIVGIAK